MGWVQGDWAKATAALLRLRKRCRHEFTVWAICEPDPKRLGVMVGRSWWRICTKCKVGETRLSETEPAT